MRRARRVGGGKALMPWELIYTSAQRGLISGQSGFCTVARTTDLRESLAQRIEQISSYHYVEYAGTSQPRHNPVISAYRVVDLRGTKFHVLSRILPCGLDFTARTNHLAHHLIFSAEELGSLPSPATILLHWNGWRNGWQGEPRLLDPLAVESFGRLPDPGWPAATWQQLTGDAGRAAGLLENDLCRGCHLLMPAGGEQSLLHLYAETLQLLNPAGKTSLRAWQHPFTTFLQGEDVATDFHWRGCQAGTPAYAQALQRAVTPVSPKTIRIPNNELARLAREGPRIQVPLPTPGQPPPLTYRRLPVRKPADDLRPAAARRQKSDAEGYNISISMKSLIGVGVAIALLLVLLGARHYWLGRTKPAESPRPQLADTSPPVNPSPPPTAGTNPANVTNPAPTPAPTPPPAPKKYVEPALGLAEAKRALEGGLPMVPTYLLLVPDLGNGDLPLTGLSPLVKLLQQFGHFDLRPADVDVSYYLNTGDGPGLFRSGVATFVKSSPNEHNLFIPVTGRVAPGSGWSFDYSGFPDKPTGGETVHLQSRFSPEQRAALAAFALVFQPAAAVRGAPRPAGFDPFGLLVISGSNPPPPLHLTKRFLQMDAGTLEASFQEPLRTRFKQFHLPGSYAWQLRPYVLSPSHGQLLDLYDLLPPETRPAAGSGLDFAGLIRIFAAKFGESSKDSELLQQKIAAATAVVVPAVDWNLKVAGILGLTNSELQTFNGFLTARTNASPSRPLFLKYLRLIAAAAGPQQAWLGSWPDQPAWDDPDWEAAHFELVLKQLQQLYALCAANLPATNAAQFTQGMANDNFFVAGLENLSREEKLQKLNHQKAVADYNVRRWQSYFENMPDSLDRVAEVRLVLTDANNQAVEFIRFSERNR